MLGQQMQRMGDAETVRGQPQSEDWNQQSPPVHKAISLITVPERGEPYPIAIANPISFAKSGRERKLWLGDTGTLRHRRGRAVEVAWAAFVYHPGVSYGAFHRSQVRP